MLLGFFSVLWPACDLLADRGKTRRPIERRTRSRDGKVPPEKRLAGEDQLFYRNLTTLRRCGAEWSRRAYFVMPSTAPAGADRAGGSGAGGGGVAGGYRDGSGVADGVVR